MRLHNQEFKDGKLVREEFVDVPDPLPTAAEQLEARIVAEVDKRVSAITEALAESDDPKVREVADRVVTKLPPKNEKAAGELIDPAGGRVR